MDEWKHSDELIAGQPADTLPPPIPPLSSLLGLRERSTAY